MWEPSVEKWLLQDVRGCWMQYGVKGKGNMGGQRGMRKSKHRQIFCLSWLSDHPKCGKCVKIWMQAQQTATTPANWPAGEPLQGAAVMSVLSCPICTLQTPRGASTQPCGTWGRAHHSQLTQPLGNFKFKTSLTFAFHSVKQEQSMSFFIFQVFCALQDVGQESPFRH